MKRKHKGNAEKLREKKKKLLNIDASKCKSLDVMFQIQSKNKDVDKIVESNSNINVTDSTLKSDKSITTSNSEIQIVLPETNKNKSMSSTFSKSNENNLRSEIQDTHCEYNYWFKKPNQNKLKIFFHHIRFNQNSMT